MPTKDLASECVIGFFSHEDRARDVADLLGQGARYEPLDGPMPTNAELAASELLAARDGALAAVVQLPAPSSPSGLYLAV